MALRNPMAAATAGRTISTVETRPRLMNRTLSSKCSAAACAHAMATVVLPIPPVPTMEMKRCCSKPATMV